VLVQAKFLSGITFIHSFQFLEAIFDCGLV